VDLRLQQLEQFPQIIFSFKKLHGASADKLFLAMRLVLIRRRNAIHDGGIRGNAHHEDHDRRGGQRGAKMRLF
jgi:hypothetical protein